MRGNRFFRPEPVGHFGKVGGVDREGLPVPFGRKWSVCRPLPPPPPAPFPFPVPTPPCFARREHKRNARTPHMCLPNPTRRLPRSVGRWLAAAFISAGGGSVLSLRIPPGSLSLSFPPIFYSALPVVRSCRASPLRSLPFPLNPTSPRTHVPDFTRRQDPSYLSSSATEEGHVTAPRGAPSRGEVANRVGPPPASALACRACFIGCPLLATPRTLLWVLSFRLLLGHVAIV